MEKCTYCVQRIRTAEIEARDAMSRRIADGEVMTACQAACPAQAIVFGDMNDQDSGVNAVEGLAAELRPAGGTEHAAAHHLPGRPAQPEPGTGDEVAMEQETATPATRPGETGDGTAACHRSGLHLPLGHGQDQLHRR